MASSKYEVVSQTIEVLLSPSTTHFEVPKFQRTYSWSGEEIDQLISDVFGESSRDDLPYFLGSIVLATKAKGEGTTSDLILDGQQRLTTISLMIASLIHKMSENKIDDATEHKNLLYSRRVKGNKKPKITLQDEDQRTYESLLGNPSLYNDQNYRNTRIGIALGRIFKSLEEHANKLLTSQIVKNNPYGYMLERLLYEVEIVRITAPSEKDAFRLFETLNDRGLALSAADLIKNKLLVQCGPEIDDAFDAWNNIVNLTREDDVVNYLRYHWIAFKGFVRKLGLYDTYKNHIEDLDYTSATLFALDIEEAARDYQQIIIPNAKSGTWGSEVSEALDRLLSYRARSCRPVILACSRHHKHYTKLCVELCESMTVRYSIVGENNPSHLENIYSELCRMLREPTFTMLSLLELETLKIIPSDDEFKEKLSKMEIQSTAPAWREILIRLNTALGTGETRIENPTRVHIEHILPRNPRAIVLNEAGVSIDEANRLTSRIGNLTLLSGKKNRQASNKPFSQKNLYI